MVVTNILTTEQASRGDVCEGGSVDVGVCMCMWVSVHVVVAGCRRVGRRGVCVWLSEDWWKGPITFAFVVSSAKCALASYPATPNNNVNVAVNTT